MKFFGLEKKEGFLKLETKNYVLRSTIEKTPYGFKLSGAVKGRPGRIEIIRKEIPEEVLVNNWQSWGVCKVVNARRYTPPPEIPSNWKYTASIFPELLRESLQSDYFIAEEGKVYGFLSSRIAHPFFLLDGKELVAYLDYFDAYFEDYVPIETFVIVEGLDTFSALRNYAILVSVENNVKLRDWEPIGWCSWYQYYDKVTWKDILNNLKIARDFPYEVFQVDEGYEKSLGDWFEMEKDFPTHSEIVETIKQHGFKPGIWLAPFSAEESSKLFASHPDWFVKRESGEHEIAYVWYENTYALDLTNDEVKEWLFNLFSVLRNMGYEYFKIDFLFAGAIPGVRRKNMTPIQAYREGMRIIRRAVGDAYILGCGAPLLPSVGYVDGMRIGPDTAPFWGEEKPDFPTPPVAAKWALRNTITRAFLHKKLWFNDPDCLLLREVDTSLLSEERKMYAYVCGILDNVVIQSDDLRLVGKEGRAILLETLLMKGGKFKIENLFSSSPEYGIVCQHKLFGTMKMYVNLEKREYKLERHVKL